MTKVLLAGGPCDGVFADVVVARSLVTPEGDVYRLQVPGEPWVYAYADPQDDENPDVAQPGEWEQD